MSRGSDPARNKNSILISDDSDIELVAFGLEDIIVVSTTDAVLVGKKKKNEIRGLVETLVNDKKRQATNFRRVFSHGDFLRP